jgi:hypothetical protein
LPIDGQNGFPGQAGAVGPRGISGVPGCNGSKVKKKKYSDMIKTKHPCIRIYDIYTRRQWEVFLLLLFYFLNKISDNRKHTKDKTALEILTHKENIVVRYLFFFFFYISK